MNIQNTNNLLRFSDKIIREHFKLVILNQLIINIEDGINEYCNVKENCHFSLVEYGFVNKDELVEYLLTEKTFSLTLTQVEVVIMNAREVLVKDAISYAVERITVMLRDRIEKRKQNLVSKKQAIFMIRDIEVQLLREIISSDFDTNIISSGFDNFLKSQKPEEN